MGLLSPTRGTPSTSGGGIAQVDNSAAGNGTQQEAEGPVIGSPQPGHVPDPASTQDEGWRKKAVKHGIARRTYTYTLPLFGTSKTYQPGRGRHCPKPGVDDLSKERDDGPEYVEAYFSPPPVIVDSRLTLPLNECRSEKFLCEVLVKSSIALSGENKPGRALMTELDACGALLQTTTTRMETARIPLLLGLQRACTDAAKVHNVQHIEEATVTRALAFLREQDLYESVLNPSMAPPTPPPDEAERRAQDLAWRLVYKLAITERGMDLLYRLTRKPNKTALDDAEKNPNKTPLDEAEKNRQRRQHLRLKHFFTVADTLLKEHAGVDTNPKPRPLRADPTTLLRYCCRQCEKEVPPPNTLLIHGLPGIQHAMCEEEKKPDGTLPKSFWQKRIDRTDRLINNNKVNQRQITTIRSYGDLFDEDFTDKLDKEVTAKRRKLDALRARHMAAMEDRFATKWVMDGHVSNAEGSMLHDVENRCHKVEKYKERSEKRDATTVVAKLKRLPQVIKASKKTPFPPPKKEGDEQHNPQSILLHREKMKSAVGIFEQLLTYDIGEIRHDTDIRQQHMLVNMARLALTRRWKDQLMRHMSSGIAPTKFDIEMLTTPANLLSLYGNHPVLEKDGPERDAFIADFKEAIPSTALMPETLLQWAMSFERQPPEIPRSSSDEYGPKPQSPHEKLIEDLRQQIYFLQHGLKTSRTPTDNPVQDFIDQTKEEILNMRLGNQRTISDGSVLGANLQSLFEVGTAAKTFGMAHLMVGAGASRRTMVNLEYGIASWGGYIRITSSGRWEGNASLGARAGPHLTALGARAGLQFQGSLEAARSSQSGEGFCFCIPRVGPEKTGQQREHGIEGDAAVAIELEKIWTILTDSAAAPENETGKGSAMPILKRICNEVPDVSVSMIGRSDNRTTGKSIGPRVSVFAGATDASQDYGANVDVSANATHARNKAVYRQPKGALQFHSTNTSKRNTAGARIAATASLGVGQKNGNFFSSGNPAGGLQGGQASGNSAAWELGRSGDSTQINRTIYEGEILRYSYKQTAWPRALDFLAYIQNNMTKFANYLASHDPECPEMPTEANDPNYKKACIKVIWLRHLLVDKHEQLIRAYIERTKKEVHSSDSFADFFELTPQATELLNRYYQSEIEFRAAGFGDKADACEKAVDNLWKNDASWAPYYFVTRNHQQSDVLRRFNLLMLLGSEHLNNTTTLPNYV